MDYQEVARREADFKATGNNGQYKLEAFKIDIPGDDELKLEGYVLRPQKRKGYYYTRKYKKEKIALHFTAGNLLGDAYTLTRNNFHVSVPFLIARDGTIYQLHSSAHWSYHLGVGAHGGNGTQSRKTIGIELSNYGYLIPKEDGLHTIYSNLYDPNTRRSYPEDIYCGYEDTEQYTKLDQPYRGQQYFTSFTDEQYESLIILLRYLTAMYDIPRTFIEESLRYSDTKEVIDFRGICSHVNFRGPNRYNKYEKWDIGPAFDWDRVIFGVQAAIYTPTTPEERALIKARARLATANEELDEARRKVELAQLDVEAAEKALQERLDPAQPVPSPDDMDFVSRGVLVDADDSEILIERSTPSEELFQRIEVDDNDIRDPDSYGSDEETQLSEDGPEIVYETDYYFGEQ